MTVKHINRKQLNNILNNELIKTPHSLLDIGCGIRPQNLVKPSVHICIEPFQEYIDKLDKNKYIIIKGMSENVLNLFENNNIDTIVLSDVIEHMEKNVGENVLKEVERIASKQIILFTPYGYLKQEENGELDAWGMHGVELQKHRSGWTENDFDDNWNIYIIDDFHTMNNIGIKYDSPKAAIYAIKTFVKPSIINKKSRWNSLWKTNK